MFKNKRSLLPSNKLFKTEYLKALCLTIIIFSLIIIGFGATKLLPKNLTTNKNNFAQVNPKPINDNNPEKGVYNVLLLGYGGGNHEGTLLTDSIIVVHVNSNTKKVSLISIPRDLWVPGNEKINASGIHGFEKASPVVTGVTGLPINYYVAVDFSNYTKLIANLGGITVKVPKTFDDPFYPIIGEENNVCGKTEPEIFDLKNRFTGFELEKQFTCRYEHLHFDGGTQTKLDGATALKFVRSRHGDSDFGRSQRQFAVLEGISNKLISLKTLNKLDENISILFNMVKTDLDLGTIKSLVQVFTDPENYKVNQIQLSSENVLRDGTSQAGAYILTPKAGNFKFDEVKSYIKSNL